MIRWLTIAEREPRPGDVLTRYGETVAVRYWTLEAVMVRGRGGLTRGVGPCPYGGMSFTGELDGPRFSVCGWYEPWRYVSRADGGQVVVPIDCGTWFEVRR